MTAPARSISVSPALTLSNASLIDRSVIRASLRISSNSRGVLIIRSRLKIDWHGCQRTSGTSAARRSMSRTGR